MDKTIKDFLDNVDESDERLETERLVLRRVGPRDIGLYGELFSDPEIMKYIQNPFPADIIPYLVAMQIHDWLEYGAGNYVIEEKETGRPVGITGMGVPQNNEAGWSLKKEYWGRGYATEATEAVMLHFYEEGVTDRVYFGIHPDNTASHKLALRLGAQITGMEKRLNGAVWPRYELDLAAKFAPRPATDPVHAPSALQM